MARWARETVRIGFMGFMLMSLASAGKMKDFSSVYGPRKTQKKAVQASPGPHLFIDDELIESSENLARRVCQPVRDSAISNPIVTGAGDRCFQPYFSVSRDAETKRWRIWYGAATDDQNPTRSRLSHMESDDGIHWIRPAKILDDPSPIQFGAEVLDQGTDFKDPTRRFIFSYWFGGGLRIATSADGLNFKSISDDVVLKHNHDITNVSWDELRKHYVATISMMLAAPKSKGERRTTLQAFSTDLLHWDEPRIVLCADDSRDEGDTQFYAMNGFVTRGPLRIGMVKVLRDDLFSDAKEILAKRGGGFGIGYTTLAWTRDGEHWIRDREKFLDRGPEGAWDRSHAWVDEQAIVGEQTYLYYAGYRSGHKANRFTDRQIGVVKMPLDRYVSREPWKQGLAKLMTVPIEMNGTFTKLTLNADASGGSIRVRIGDLPWSEAISKGGVALPLSWAQPLKLDHGQVQLQFELERAKLFAFEFLP